VSILCALGCDPTIADDFDASPAPRGDSRALEDVRAVPIGAGDARPTPDADAGADATTNDASADGTVRDDEGAVDATIADAGGKDATIADAGTADATKLDATTADAAVFDATIADAATLTDADGAIADGAIADGAIDAADAASVDEPTCSTIGPAPAYDAGVPDLNAACTVNDRMCVGNAAATCWTGHWTTAAPCSTPGLTSTCWDARCNVPLLSAGYQTTCSTSAPWVRCWGANGSGQVGDGTTIDRSYPTPSKLTNPRMFNVAVGATHIVAMEYGGAVDGWGSNDHDELARSDLTSSLVPVSSGFGNGRMVSAGRGYSCVLLTSGLVECAGENGEGQLGDGTTLPRATKVTVALTDVSTITTGEAHACAVRKDGTVWCWGRNTSGQLGDGTQISRAAPVQVPGVTGWTISAGASHTCMSVQGGTVRCWGDNSFGQLGDGTKVSRSTPQQVVGLTGASDVHAGGAFTCAVHNSSGQVRCWGNNRDGALGNDVLDEALTPKRVPGLFRVNQLVVGASHACAVQTNGSVACWGKNDVGQIGDGTFGGRRCPTFLRF
jgi:alpha-tubulin suppressor-like RCC1 family protein